MKKKFTEIASNVPAAYRKTANYNDFVRDVNVVGSAVELASSLTGKKIIQAGAAGAIAFKKAGQVSNTLAKAGLSLEIQQAGATLAAAILGAKGFRRDAFGNVASYGKAEVNS